MSKRIFSEEEKARRDELMKRKLRQIEVDDAKKEIVRELRAKQGAARDSRGANPPSRGDGRRSRRDGE